MTDYVNKIEIATVNTADDSPLQDSKLSGFSSSRHATEVDSTFRHARVPLQDTWLGSTCKWGPWKRSARCKSGLEAHERGCINWKKLALSSLDFQENPCLYFVASLGKSKSARAQQGEIHLLTTQHALKGSARASILEFHSHRVHRVARSSLAAEGCAMVSASDRQLFNRVLFDALMILMYGSSEITKEWRRNLSTVGWTVTGAKGLHDHVHKTGGVASEKQAAALDILMTKQLVEDGV